MFLTVGAKRSACIAFRSCCGEFDKKGNIKDDRLHFNKRF